jgi:hypothetical protein
MEKWGKQLSAASGLVFMVLLGVALSLPGKPPRANDPAAQIAATVASHRSEFLVGTYLAGVALIFGAWFFAAVRSWLTEETSGDETYAGVAFAGGLLFLALTLLGFVLFYGFAFQAAAAQDLAVVRGLTDAGNSAFELAKFGLATFVIFTSVATRRDAILPAWFTWAGLAAGSLSILGAISLFATGSATEIGSSFDLLSAVPAALWTILLSLQMVRQRRR